MSAESVAPPPLLLIVTGLPASGKTTLARQLSGELNLPCLHKDDLKEHLMDTLGTQDRAWSQQLGAATIGLLWQLAGTLLARGVSVMVECPFDPRLAVGQLQALNERVAFRMAQIECRAETDELVRRFSARLPERHPGHMDDHNVEEHRSVATWNPSLLIDWPGERFVLHTQTESAESLLNRLQSLFSPT